MYTSHRGNKALVNEYTFISVKPNTGIGHHGRTAKMTRHRLHRFLGYGDARTQRYLLMCAGTARGRIAVGNAVQGALQEAEEKNEKRQPF